MVDGKIAFMLKLQKSNKMGRSLFTQSGDRKDITDMKQKIAAAMLMLSMLCSIPAFAVETEPEAAPQEQAEFTEVTGVEEIEPPVTEESGETLTAEAEEVQPAAEPQEETQPESEPEAEPEETEDNGTVWASATMEESAEATDTMQEAFALYTSFTTRKSPWKGNTYTVPADYNVFDGLDLSKWQEDINWAKLKKDGVEFVILRCGYRGYGTGELVEDVCYDDHMAGAAKQGIPAGIYLYSQAITTAEAVEEADFCIEQAKKYDVQLPLVIDIEYAENENGFTGRLYEANLSVAAQTKIAKAFCDRVEEAGYVPMIYASASMLRDIMDADALSEEGMIWMAHYTTKTSYDGVYQYWQYTDSGTVDGISGKVDCNFYFTKGDSPTDLGSWNKNEGTILFETNGGSAVSAITADVGTTVTRPKAPTKDGYLFAGWYTDSDLTEPRTSWKMTADTTTLYAKWVPESMLNTKAQLSSGTEDSSDKTSMRILSSVDSTQYKSVGFVLSTTENGNITSSNDSCTTVNTTTVYSNILADDELLSVDEIGSQYFCDESKYLFALTLNDIPNSKFASEIYLRPFFITKDGTTVYGTTSTRSVGDMLQN